MDLPIITPRADSFKEKIVAKLESYEQQYEGIKLLQDCTVSSVAPASAAARAAVPRGWSLTEVNHTPLNLLKGGQEDLNRLSAGCREVTLLLQPAPFVRKIRAVIKANKH